MRTLVVWGILASSSPLSKLILVEVSALGFLTDHQLWNLTQLSSSLSRFGNLAQDIKKVLLALIACSCNQVWSWGILLYLLGTNLR